MKEGKCKRLEKNCGEERRETGRGKEEKKNVGLNL